MQSMRIILQIIIILLNYEFIKTESRNFPFPGKSVAARRSQSLLRSSPATAIVTAFDRIKDLSKRGPHSMHEQRQAVTFENLSAKMKIGKNIRPLARGNSIKENIRYHFGMPREFILQIPKIFKIFFKELMKILY